MGLTRHLPNLVTLSRGATGFLVAGLVWSNHHVAAFFVFIAAILTDLVDGWLARKLNAYSPWGVFLDALADKVLTSCTWVALWTHGWAPTAVAAPILLRNVIVAALWALNRHRGQQFEPNLLGRLMISFEGVTLPFLLLHVTWMGVHWASAGVILAVVTLALSLASAAQYAIYGPAHKGSS